MSDRKPFRPAWTVYDQIRWDPRLDPDEFRLGYIDRGGGAATTLAVPFADFVPGGRIPWGRVQRFWRGGELVWDREARVDALLALPPMAPADGGTQGVGAGDSGDSAELEPLPVWRFVGGRWREDDGGSLPGAGAAPPVIRLLTWNVLFDLYPDTAFEPERRWAALRAAILESGAELVALQEVTPGFLGPLLDDPGIRERYRVSDVSGETVTPYGQLLLSRLPLDGLGQKVLSRSKRFLIARLTLAGRSVSVAVVHLTSDKHVDGAEKRRAQLVALAGLLRGDAIVAGDFNHDDAEHQPALAARGFRDAWRVCRPDAPGFTFDPRENPLTALISSRTRRRRLDRVLSRGPGLKPLSAAIVGTAPIGGGLTISDHFGVSVTLGARPLSAEVPTVLSALALVPPREVWGPIQAIRALHDRGVERWPPHLNLLYGFVPEARFEEAAAIAEEALSALAPLAPSALRFSRFEVFAHKRSATVWLAPDDPAPLRALQARLAEAFPGCRDHERHGGFTPHLSVGQARGVEAARALAASLQASWTPISFEASAVTLLARGAETPFEPRWRVPVGGVAEREGGDLASALRQLGEGADPARSARRAAVIAAVIAAVNPPEGTTHVLGSRALGVDGPTSDLDLLTVLPAGRGRDDFFASAAAALARAGSAGEVRAVRDALVPVLSGVIDGESVDLACATLPAGVDGLAALTTSQLEAMAGPDRRGALGVLDLWAVQRAVSEERRSAFTDALRGLRAWAAARDIDAGAWGFVGGLGWAVVAARAASDCAPDASAGAMLERCFELMVARDDARPFTLDGSAAPPEGDAPLQLLTPTAPRSNIARRSTRATAAVLDEELVGGLERLWRIRAGEAHWTTLFVPVDPRAHAAHVVLALAAKPASLDTSVCEGWLAGQAGTLIARLEASAPLTPRPHARPLTQSDDDAAIRRWYIGLERRPEPEEALAMARVVEGLVARFERWSERPEGVSLTGRVR